jgi:phosphoribosylformimino-5-aminoimidazole carboxamide ribonucleotide (ProFAR) isomerase
MALSQGKPENLEYVLEIKKEFPDVNLQLGGGVRDLETLDSIFKSGIDDVI